ncbi:hypothetical protein QTP86_005701 [Hemibagrus guttatus]|nr:hypothetical protein QTP86_005701 [Hemibagrus guttatus]
MESASEQFLTVETVLLKTGHPAFLQAFCPLPHELHLLCPVRTQRSCENMAEAAVLRRENMAEAAVLEYENMAEDDGTVWIGFMDIVPVIGAVKESVELVLAVYEGNEAVIKEKVKALENFVNAPFQKHLTQTQYKPAGDAAEFSGLVNVRGVPMRQLAEHVKKGSKNQNLTSGEQNKRERQLEKIRNDTITKLNSIGVSYGELKEELKEELTTDTLLSSLSSTMDFLCPLSTIRRKNSSPAPWLSDVLRNNRRELRSAARKWKKSKLDTDLISYRTLLSKFSLDVTSAKTSFYKEKLETSAQDPRKLHNIFSSLLNPPAPPSPSSLTDEDFASFYTEKIERICQTFTSLPTSPTSHNQHSATPSLTQLSTVAAEEVLQITRSCNPTTCPLDPIPSAMLQTISPDLLPFITTVINGSLTSGHVPTAFKKARVIPILKKPALDPSDISNYRLVSLLSFLSKILERVVCNQLSDYLLQNNLHDPNQSGFKAAHSTETALLAVTEKLHAARSAKLSSVLILLHLSAAFDTVNHKTLLSTLRSLGICGTAWEWFASYLDGRSYQVTWKGLTSAPRRLSTDVPQGSVLGPLLFSLYTHSLGKVISSHGFSYHCYADDTQLIFSFPPSDTTASARISACLADISSWMTAHQLKLNPSKTELLIIPGDPSPAQDLAISLSNSMISPSASARNLGVTMDNQLSFSSHVTNVTRSCRFLLYNIRRIRPFLSTQVAQVLVQSLVISEIGLLQLSSGRSTSERNPSTANDPKCSCTTCFQPAQVLPHHPTAAFPPLASSSCTHQIQHTNARLQSQEWTSTILPQSSRHSSHCTSLPQIH